MSDIPKDLLYAKSHEWVRKGGGRTVIVGISDFAQAALGDVTYLQLPELGRVLARGEVFGTVESVKAVSELYAPLSGKVTKLNDALTADPAPLNSSPYGQGWVLEMEISNEGELGELLKPEAYASVAV